MKRIFGVDISRHNSDEQFSEIMVMPDIDFIMFKATEGVTYTDPKFKARARKAIDIGIKVGFYHYARPENNAIAKREANNFLKAVEEFGNDVVYALDWEGAAEKCDPFWITKWCSFIEQKTSRIPMVYMNYSYAKNLATDLSKYPLWLAKWGGDVRGERIGHWNDGYTIWQFTNEPYDKNAFDGTLEDFISIGKAAGENEEHHFCGCCCCKE